MESSQNFATVSRPIQPNENYRIEQACTAAEVFAKIYYETLDKRRHILLKFYMTDATLVWNGRSIAGEAAIGRFYESLPISETTLTSLSAIPVSEVAVSGGMTVLVQICGSLSFQKKASVPFFQVFLLTQHDDKWKIVNDSFRFQE